MYDEEGQPYSGGGEGEGEGGGHGAGVEPGQRACGGEAEGLPGEGFCDGSRLGFHEVRHLPAGFAICLRCDAEHVGGLRIRRNSVSSLQKSLFVDKYHQLCE
ncbi:hypothetical protein [uncultured Hoeflea sp.]|uniref:hypothetical protein n=1 Tax=uncultured Hoeflea sp. TaxID=538666 RepID=UPI0026293B0B|nr:hypothetical protein [uncultured Hoeflea sp.]